MHWFWGLLSFLARGSVPAASLTVDESWTALSASASDALRRGNYVESERLYSSALAVAEKFEPEENRIATTVANLGTACRMQGRPDEAEKLYLRAIDIWRSTLERAPDELAAALNNLAGIYRVSGRFTQSEALYQEALALNEKYSTNENANCARVLTNLGALYADHGKFSDAQRLYERALAIQEKLFGPDHPRRCSHAQSPR
jgi:tetratricopeptide (TPR) repeat protein